MGQSDVNIPLRTASISNPCPEDFDSIDQIAEAYDQVPRTSFQGRLRYAHTINKCAALAGKPAPPNQFPPYYVQVIITHGSNPEDLENDELGDAVVAASHTPMSLIFVHLGTYSVFARMFMLDKKPERSTTGLYSRRQILQATNGTWDPLANAGELQEILSTTGHQFMSLMELQGLKPGSDPKEAAAKPD